MTKQFSDLYMVDFEIHEGESEYHQQSFIHATNSKDAEKQAGEYIKGFWSNMAEPEDDWYWREDLGACVIINWVSKVNSLEEIIDRVGEI